MKIVVAPQSFKGSLSAQGVAQAMAAGIRRALPDADIVVVPMADGGEGTVEALVHGTGGRFIVSEVTGPLGDRVNAQWGLLGDGATAVIEMAAASGITLVPSQRLNPLLATTYGTGELVRAALDAGCRKLMVCLGGSATNDGGAGMAQALGLRLLDDLGRELGRGGAELARLARIDYSGLDSRLCGCDVVAVTDVRNPLCGPRGASWVYGPQKGATEDMCRQLDAALAHYAEVIKRDLGIEVKDVPGAGAAGGMGAGLLAFLGARTVSGIDVVSDAAKLSHHLEGAGLVFTGEGRLDAQTSFGKTIAGVAARARALQVPVIVIAGEVAGSQEQMQQMGVQAALSIARGPMALADSMVKADGLVSDAAETAMKLILTRPKDWH